MNNLGAGIPGGTHMQPLPGKSAADVKPCVPLVLAGA